MKLGLQVRIALAVFALLSGGFAAYYVLVPRTPSEPGKLVIPGLRREGDGQFDWYRKYVMISNVRADLARNYLGDEIAVVSGLLENRGEKRLEAAELKVTLLDPQDQPVLQQARTPLRPGIGIQRPLHSFENRSFTIWIEPLPPGWTAGQVVVELSGLKFEE